MLVYPCGAEVAGVLYQSILEVLVEYIDGVGMSFVVAMSNLGVGMIVVPISLAAFFSRLP